MTAMARHLCEAERALQMARETALLHGTSLCRSQRSMDIARDALGRAHSVLANEHLDAMEAQRVQEKIEH